MIYKRTTKTGKPVLFQYSEEDQALADNFIWFINSTGYATTNLKIDGVKRTRMFHRMVMKEPQGFVDHIDGDRANNLRTNLRRATQSQNQMNRGPQKNNTSGYKGVSYRKRDGKYDVFIILMQKQMFLGSCVCKHEAARLYNKAAIKYHGKFAYLNTILEE